MARKLASGPRRPLHFKKLHADPCMPLHFTVYDSRMRTSWWIVAAPELATVRWGHTE